MSAPPRAPRGVTRLAGTTPGTLTLLALMMIVVSTLGGVISAWSVQTRADSLEELATRSEPLAFAAQEVYRALSDADASAASAFLGGGVEPAELRSRYQTDIAQAQSALAIVTDGGAQAPELAEALHTLSVQLPVYTGLVETARTNNRQGAPVGAAYLREASELMRAQLLPAAERIYRAENANVVRDQDASDGLPVLEVLFGLLTLACIVVAGRFLSRRTNRTFNLGLAVAGGAAGLSLLWIVVASTVVVLGVADSRTDGSAQVDVLVDARVATLNARGDETLTLVARGSGQSFEQHYDEVTTELGGESGSDGLLGRAAAAATSQSVRDAVNSAVENNRAWREAHEKIRQADDAGDYTGAVTLTLSGEPGNAAAAFDQLDADLVRAISEARAAFAQEVAGARGALTGLAPGSLLLALLGAAAAGWGMWQRLKEYR
ncbi:hypothetical protein [Umezawaea beigongshangensis]|uniref:hypothetical protein n=1 Tax=Umezawaea beigongshangensis TaxID=2780383 RepID=UPI0018F1ADB7|nr:hypothetical protein [Umezawaea beigongshangensis]